MPSQPVTRRKNAEHNMPRPMTEPHGANQLTLLSPAAIGPPLFYLKE